MRVPVMRNLVYTRSVILPTADNLPISRTVHEPDLIPLRFRSVERVVDRKHLLLAIYIATLTLAALMKVASGDPRASVGGGQSVYELGLLALATASLLIWVRGYLPLSLFGRAPILAALLHATWAVLSSIWSLEPLLSLGKGLELLLLVVNAALFVFGLRQHGLSRHLYTILTWAILGVTLLFLCFNLVVWGTPVRLEEAELQRVRLWLGYTHPLWGAELLASGLLCSGLSRLPLGLKLPLMAFFGFLLLLTNARLAVLAALIGFVICLAVRAESDRIPTARFRLLLGTLLTISTVLAVAWFTTPEFFEEQLDFFPSDVRNLNGRLNLWEIVFELAFSDPARAALGYGYYASRFLFLDFFNWAGHAHQAFLEVLITTGWLGLAMVGCFLWCVAALARRSGSLLSIATFAIVQSLGEPVLFQPRVTTLVLLWAVVHALLRDEPRLVEHLTSAAGTPSRTSRLGLPGANGVGPSSAGRGRATRPSRRSRPQRP